MNKYILIGDDIVCVDTFAERVEARRLLQSAGIRETMIYLGGPEEDHGATGQLLTSDQSHEPVDMDGADDPYPSHADADLPTDENLAEMLATLINPECDEAMRDEVIEQLTGYGSVSTRSFREAGVLTNNAGFVIRIGSTEFQVSVVS